MESCISINNLTKSFGDKKVLGGLTLDIKRGEIFGLLGPSGAGKTTLIRILTGQLRQSAGTASLLGKDTTALSQDIYSQLGMVLDNTGVYERLSCYDNLLIFARIFNIDKKRIDDTLRGVGLTYDKRRPAGKLSKGMRQRLILARALMTEPKALFLDEPTSGLDPATAAEIHKLISAQRDKGTTVFLTTHNMEEAAKLCDNVALLHDGRIVEYGGPREVCRRYNHQNRIDILLTTGEEVCLPNDSSAAAQVCGYFERGVVSTIHSTEPDLETVFMELTGRRFI